MKKTTILLIFLMLTASAAWAYDSGIAVHTDKGTHMQVYVNGKLYNKQPGNFVRVRSTPGVLHLEVKVMNEKNKTWHTARKQIRVSKGYEFQYKVVFVNQKPEIVEVKKYPVYSRYYINTGLYNRHPIS